MHLFSDLDVIFSEVARIMKREEFSLSWSRIRMTGTLVSIYFMAVPAALVSPFISILRLP